MHSVAPSTGWNPAIAVDFCYWLIWRQVTSMGAFSKPDSVWWVSTVSSDYQSSCSCATLSGGQPVTHHNSLTLIQAAAVAAGFVHLQCLPQSSLLTFLVYLPAHIPPSWSCATVKHKSEFVILNIWAACSCGQRWWLCRQQEIPNRLINSCNVWAPAGNTTG